MTIVGLDLVGQYCHLFWSEDVMTLDAAEERLLFKAAERVMAAEQKLARAKNVYEEVCAEILGEGYTPPCGGVLSYSGGEIGPVDLNTGDADGGTSSVIITLDHRDHGLTIRARLERYCRDHSARSLSAETIANALGTKLTTTRFELYQLQKAGIVIKLGIDQWKYAKQS
jgi:hypothetical protein